MKAVVYCRKLFLLFITVSSFCFSSNAQEWSADSVVWQEYYLTGYNLYRLGNLDSAEYYFAECERLSEKHDQPYFLFKAKFATGSSMISRSNYLFLFLIMIPILYLHFYLDTSTAKKPASSKDNKTRYPLSDAGNKF